MRKQPKKPAGKPARLTKEEKLALKQEKKQIRMEERARKAAENKAKPQKSSKTTKGKAIGKANKPRFNLNFGGMKEKLKTVKLPNMSLKIQLIIGFLIPIAFLIYVGFFSYNKAVDGMLSNYESSTIMAINMASDLIDYGLQAADTDSLQITLDDNLKNYTMDMYKNDVAAKSTAYNSAKKTVLAKTSSQFISNIYILSGDALNNIVTSGNVNADKDIGLYDRFMEEYKTWDDPSLTRMTGSWNSSHPVLDEQYNVDPNEYICVKYRAFSAQNAWAVIDIKADKIREILDSVSQGDGSIMAFVTKEDKELFTGDVTDFSFSDKEYYQKGVAGQSDNYTEYVTYHGKQYLFMYSRCETNDAAICALVPKSELMTEAISMRNGALIMILLSSVVVLIIGSIILWGISKKMGSITKRLAKVSTGDLTVDMRIKDKAEFGKLASHIMETVTNTKDLIVQVKGISGEVGKSVEQVADASNILQESMQNIHSAMSEIDEGVTQQANDAEQCLLKMDSLSSEILNTGNNVQEMGKIAQATQDMIISGTTSMDKLTQQASETGDITNHVGEKIAMLSQSAESIKVFADTINDIAEETTLLSLNASIEAARAGSAGRGFAVVAEAIKKLADNSLQSSGEIRKVMDEINRMTNETTKASKEASEIVKNQSSTVEQTRQVFGEMSDCITQLLDIIQKITVDMEQMTKDRGETLLSIESISSISEETAASSNVVNDTVGKQMNQIDNLLQTTTDLNSKMQELLAAIQNFIV